MAAVKKNKYIVPKAKDLPLLPWSQRTDEPNRMFDAFKVYKSLGPARNIEDTAAKIDAGKESFRETLCEWSSSWGWGARARLWDKEQERVRVIEEREAIRDMVRRHIGIALKGQKAAMETLKEYIEEGDDGQPAKKMTPAVAIRLLETCHKMERLARGLPDNISHHEGSYVIDVQEQRGVLLQVMQSPDGVEHMAAISKLMGTDGSEAG
jgi:hypothetical protein